MRDAPEALKTFLLSSNVAWRADLITLTLKDSTVMRLTTADLNLTVGGQTYLAGGGESPVAPMVRRSLVRQSAGLEVDTLDLDLVGPFSIGGVPLGVLAARGYFDRARVRIDHLIGPTPGDVSLGPIPAWFEGRVSGVEPGGISVHLRLKDERAALNVPLPKTIMQVRCNNVLFDVGCGLSREERTDTGVVAAVTDSTAIEIGGGTVHLGTAHYYDLGCILFTSGPLTGRRAGVAADGWTYPPALKLAMPLEGLPNVGDTISIIPGCDRARATCDERFSNLAHFRGFNRLPRPESGRL
jgi:hypothetical protein